MVEPDTYRFFVLDRSLIVLSQVVGRFGVDHPHRFDAPLPDSGRRMRALEALQTRDKSIGEQGALHNDTLPHSIAPDQNSTRSTGHF